RLYIAPGHPCSRPTRTSNAGVRRRRPPMSRTILYAIVFLIGATPFLESTLIIPLGALGGLSVPAITVVSVIGNLLTLLLSVVLAERIGTWVRRRREHRHSNEPHETASARKRQKGEKALTLWKKYGLP